MANFSGRFSTNDAPGTNGKPNTHLSPYAKVCDGLVEFYVDWEVIRDLDYNTYKFKVDLYMDASRCKYLSTKKISDQPTRQSTFAFRRFYPGEKDDFGDTKGETLVPSKAEAVPGTNLAMFAMPQFSTLLTFDTSKVQHLYSGESDSLPVGEESITIGVDSVIRPNHVLRAYESNILSYVESNTSNYQEWFYREFPIRGIIPNRITDISGSGVLGSPHTIKVSRGEPEFTHTIECICGGSTATVCTKSTAESLSFTPPLSFAAENTHGTDLDAVFKITTYYGDRVKEIQTIDYALTIPSTVVPSCTLEITDGEFRDGEYVSVVYGGYVQSHSRFHIKTIPTLAYGSPIEKYEIVVDGLIYNLTEAEMDTPLIKESGTHSIKARVTDARGHTSEYYTTTESVQPYSAPVVSDLTASRCNIDGSANPQGDCMKVVFSAQVTPLSNKNRAVYSIVHSKSSGLDYVERVLGDYTGQYTVTNGEYIFAADLDSTYTIQVTAVDDFEEHTRSAGGGLTTILMNWLASGHGMCFGGVATLEDTVECKFKFYPSGGLLIPPYKATNLFIRDPGVYYVENPADIDSCPVDDPFIIEIMPVSADGIDLFQRLTTCPQGEAPRVLVRTLVSSSWGQFYDMTTGQAL